MASPAWFLATFATIAPSTRFPALFAMSDRDLARRGYDRLGLTRSFISGHAGF